MDDEYVHILLTTSALFCEIVFWLGINILYFVSILSTFNTALLFKVGVA